MRVWISVTHTRLLFTRFSFHVERHCCTKHARLVSTQQSSSGLHTVQWEPSALSAKCCGRQIILLNYLPHAHFFKIAAPASVFCEFLCKIFTWRDFNQLCQLTGSMLFSLNCLELSRAITGQRRTGAPLAVSHIKQIISAQLWGVIPGIKC